MVFEFEYFWAILLLFVMERICCLQEQFEQDFIKLPDPLRSNESLTADIDEFANRDFGLKLSFLRLCRLMHVSILLSVAYFCNVCIWFMMIKRSSPQTVHYLFRLMPS